jgi:ADP-heptose:LPS heptosyltransferase
MRLDNMGDVVMAGPTLRAIKKAIPGVHLTFMVSPAGAQVAPLLPWVDDVFALRVLWQDLGNLPFDPARERAVVRELRDRRFDGAVILTSFSQSPYPAGLACLLAGIPLRLGQSKEEAAGILTVRVTPLPDAVHQVDRNLHLLRAIGIQDAGRKLSVRIDEYSRLSTERLLSAVGVKGQDRYVLLNPWASAEARTYPTGRFVEVARGLAGRTGLPVVVTGDEKHCPHSTEFTAAGEGMKSVVGRTTVRELAALVKGAALVLTNNTSTMHFADALEIPAVVLYSGTEQESQWRPRFSLHRLLRRPTACSPCYAFTCPFHMECLDIAPEDVVEAAVGLLEATG